MTEWQNVDERQFTFERPDFLSESRFDWLSMAETRRVHGSPEPMSGSIALTDAIIDQGLRFEFPNLNEEELVIMREHQRLLAGERLEQIRRGMGLAALATLRAAHGTNLIDADDHMRDLHYSRGTSRPIADAAVVHRIGNGIVINPADCPVATLVHAPNNPQRRAVAQIHAGWQGLISNIVRRTIPRLTEEYGFELRNTIAYIQPHASSGFEINGDGLEKVRQATGTAYLDEIDDDTERYDLDMTGMMEDQLRDAGIRDSALIINRKNSMTDPELYSHRARFAKGFTGRNALAVGIRTRLDS